MFSILDIVRRDAATYYEYDSNNRVGRFRTLGGFAVLSLIVGSVVGTASNEFLGGALSAQAILVGFSFNVLFYLVANRLTAPAVFTSIEHELRFERLSKLSDEVFDNVTYFNLIAIVSAITALALLLSGSHHLEVNLHRIADYLSRRYGVERDAFGWAKTVAFSLALAALIFLLSESVYTFLRAVGRVRFYFGMLRTMNAES